MRDFCLDNLDVSLDQGILDTHKGSFGHLLIASGDTGYGGAGTVSYTHLTLPTIDRV